MRYLLVGLGGFFGAAARYFVGNLVGQATSMAFPLGTLLINVSGSFLLGLIFQLGTERLLIAPEARILAGVGFLGAYTTFSTFSLETARLIQDGATTAALLNVASTLFLGIAAVFAGIWLAKVL